MVIIQTYQIQVFRYTSKKIEEDEKDGSRSMPLTISINGEILLDETKDEESKKSTMKKREERKARRSLVLAKIKNLKKEDSIDSITNSNCY